jgi:hypothetical protein
MVVTMGHVYLVPEVLATQYMIRGDPRPLQDSGNLGDPRFTYGCSSSPGGCFTPGSTNFRCLVSNNGVVSMLYGGQQWCGLQSQAVLLNNLGRSWTITPPIDDGLQTLYTLSINGQTTYSNVQLIRLSSMHPYVHPPPFDKSTPTVVVCECYDLPCPRASLVRDESLQHCPKGLTSVVRVWPLLYLSFFLLNCTNRHVHASWSLCLLLATHATPGTT